jgi:O-antigen/teichoic acid export membrane protein
VFPAYVLFITLADRFLVIIFGSQWEPAVPVFQVFAGFAFIRTFAVLASGIYTALNKAHILLFYNAFRLVPSLAVLLYLGATGASLLTVSIALLVLWYIQTPFYLIALFKILHIHLRDLVQEFRLQVIAAVLMAAVILGSDRWIVGPSMNDWLRMMMTGLMGCGVFLIVMREELAKAFAFIRESFARKRSDEHS